MRSDSYNIAKGKNRRTRIRDSSLGHVTVKNLHFYTVLGEKGKMKLFDKGGKRLLTRMVRKGILYAILKRFK